MTLHRLAPSSARVAIAMSFFAAAPVAWAQGKLVGRVTIAGSDDPVPDARVAVLGKNTVACTGSDGAFVLNNVAAGTLSVQLFGEGYALQEREVTVPAGGVATANFGLVPTPFRLAYVARNPASEVRSTADALLRGVKLRSDQRSAAEAIVARDIAAAKALDTSAPDFMQKHRELMDERNSALKALLDSEGDRTRFAENLKSMAFCHPSAKKSADPIP